MKLLVPLGAMVVFAALVAATADAEEDQQPAAIEVTVEEVLTGLDNPCSVAIQPETAHVFVAESGASRVVRFNPASTGKVEEVISGFPKDVYGKGPKYEIGPLGLGFIDKNTLVVGGGGLPDGSELLRIYKVPGPGKTIPADEMKHKLGPIAASEKTAHGEGNFYGVAISSGAIYATCNGDDTKGWVARADLSGGKPGEFELFIPTKVATEVDAPVGITLHPAWGFIVIGQMGEINNSPDSLLTFYLASDGKMLMNLETGLHDIAGLAYSPIKPRLYAVDFAWADNSQGGLFRLDLTLDEQNRQGCKAVKVVTLDKPTSLAFAPDGTLYVTVMGTAAEGATEKPGKLLKIKGKL